jgi:hypothetical protein
MHQKRIELSYTYQIRFKDALHPSMTDWLGEITILPQQNGKALLIDKLADQAALRGLLDQFWNMNFTVLSVDKVDNEKDCRNDLCNQL